MAQYLKGLDTKMTILNAAGHLFYKKGYTATTVREIARRANVNSGLINYYFNSKSQLGLTIYSNLRDVEKEFWIDQGYEGDLYNLLLCVSEFKLAFNSKPFSRFYFELTKDMPVSFVTDNPLLGYDQSYFPDLQYMQLIETALVAAKIALINRYLSDVDHTISPEEYISFYLKHLIQVFQLKDPDQWHEKCITQLNKFTFTLNSDFVPVITPVSH